MVDFEFHAYFRFKIWNSQILYLKRHHEKSEGADIHRSKLEIYEDILITLVNQPLTIDAVAFACNMDCFTLRQRLNFLAENDMVEEKNYKKKTRYALTRRGLAILKTLTITRKLEKLQTTIKNVDKALRQNEPNETKTIKQG